MLGAPIVKALLGKAAVPDDSPYTTGGIGLLGTEPSQEALEELRHAADGRHAASPTSSSIPKPGQARAVQIDSTRRGSACAIRSRSAWSATAARRSRRCCRCSSRNERPRLPGDRRRRA